MMSFAPMFRSIHKPLTGLLPGLVLSAGMALAAMALGRIDWMQAHGLSALTVAIMLGMLLGNTVLARMPASCDAGVRFSKQNLLRLGIVLYGLRLTFQDIAQVGVRGVLIDAVMLTSTFAMAYLIGVKLFKLERNAVLLIGAGSSICGAAAVMATEPVLRARSEQVTVAVSTVVVFGSLAMFLYPMLHQWSQQLPWWHQQAPDFGIYIGSTVHEVAQVLAAARSIDESTANTAVIAKMVRVMMLAPFLLILSACMRRSAGKVAAGGKDKLGVPWFAFAFIGVVALHSIAPLPAAVNAFLLDVDTLLLAMAMAALGLTTQASAVRRAGMRPLLLGGLLFGWLIVGGAVINRALT